jgi:hypothetical protein
MTSVWYLKGLSDLIAGTMTKSWAPACSDLGAPSGKGVQLELPTENSLSPAPTYHLMLTKAYKQHLQIVLCLLSFYFISTHYMSIMPPTRQHDDFSKYTDWIFLPYVHRFSTDLVPEVHATIGGIDFELPVDTGSTGLMIGAPRLPHISLDEGEPAYEYLTSSRILYNGRLVNQSITFHGEYGAYATATVPILVVDRSMVCPWYKPGIDGFDCPIIPGRRYPEFRDVSRITYMGVGFGRNTLYDNKPKALPSGNPFLNLRSINGSELPLGSLRTGYTISIEGVHLGLTATNAAGFLWTGLEKGVTHASDPRDWAMVKMCFEINGEGNNCGSALIDTGIPQMYLRTDVGVETPNVTIRNPNKEGDAEYVRRVKFGTKIMIGFPTLEGKDHVIGYSVEVGQEKPMAPTYVVPTKQAPPPYVNTGRNFLRGMDVAFDADGGRFGFRPRHPPSQTSHASL